MSAATVKQPITVPATQEEPTPTVAKISTTTYITKTSNPKKTVTVTTQGPKSTKTASLFYTNTCTQTLTIHINTHSAWKKYTIIIKDVLVSHLNIFYISKHVIAEYYFKNECASCKFIRCFSKIALIVFSSHPSTATSASLDNNQVSQEKSKKLIMFIFCSMFVFTKSDVYPYKSLRSK